jgi:large subunit ribosomal protein L29
MQVSELRKKSVDELNEELVALRREQFNLRMQQATAQLEKPSRIRQLRRDIARIKTVMTERARTVQ